MKSTKPVTENQPTKTFRKFLKYYEHVLFHKVFSDQSSVITVQRKVPILYFVSRLIATISLIQLLRLLILCILEGHGSQESIAFKVSGLTLYIVAYSMIPYYDIAVYMSEILPNVEKTVKVCEDIWNKIGSMSENARALQKQLSFKMWRIFIHNCFIDYMTLLDFAANTYGNFSTYDVIGMYSEIPWKNDLFDLVYWMAGVLSLFAMTMTWSWLVTLPGCLAFQYECLLKGLTAHLKASRSIEIERSNVFHHYTSLSYATRLLFKNGLSKALLSLYAVGALQQTITSFFIFNIIRSGAEWEKIEVFLLDLMFSTSRAFHGYYALSRVSNANKELLDLIDVYLTKLETGKWPSKIIRKKAEILQELNVTVGPFRCDSDFPLSGGGVYLDNLVTAALW